MNFDQQQKGLFTFYKQQELFEQQIQQRKRKTKQKTLTQNRLEPTKMSSQTDFKNLARTKIDSQPTPTPENATQRQKTEHAIKFKKYGQAVVIVNRKETEHLKANEIKYDSMATPIIKQHGYFLQNKNVSFDSPLRQTPFKQSPKDRQTLTRRKILFLKRREDSVMSSKRYEQDCERTSRLPALSKGQPKSDQPRNKITGSLIKSNGSDLLRQIRSNAINDSRIQREEVKRSVSYIEYNKDYYNDSDGRKKEHLSSQQKKLLEILSRYRRNDF